MRRRPALKPRLPRGDLQGCQVRMRILLLLERPAAKSRSFETTAEANYTRRY